MLDLPVDSKVKEQSMRIGELAAASGVPTSTLRFYDEAGLVPSRRAANGYRVYDEAAVARVRFVKHAQTAGLTLDHIGRVLAVRDDGEAPCVHVSAFVDARLATVEERMAELEATRDQLLTLRARAADLDPADCPPEAICQLIPAG